LSLTGELNILANIRLCLRPKSFHLLDLAVLCGRLQFFETRYSERLVQRAHGPGANPFDSSQRLDIHREFRAELSKFRDLASLKVFGDFGRDGVANAVDLGECVFTLAREILNGCRVVSNIFGCTPVDTGFVIGSASFLQIRKLLEESSYLVVSAHCPLFVRL
jgi:hypothetical protein